MVAWSSGKDSAWALHEIRRRGDFELMGLLTTFTEPYDRVSMHGVRASLVRAQAAALGLPLYSVEIPAPCPNAIYEQRFAAVLVRLARIGVSHVVFGDLFLRDVREYRERQLARVGMQGVFPLWGRDTGSLAAEMIQSGVQTVLVCVDPAKVPPELAGEWFGQDLLSRLPAGVDPCGENGEFHTFVSAGPMFSRALKVAIGDRVERDGFVFVDVTLAE